LEYVLKQAFLQKIFFFSGKLSRNDFLDKVLSKQYQVVTPETTLGKLSTILNLNSFAVVFAHDKLRTLVTRMDLVGYITAGVPDQ